MLAPGGRAAFTVWDDPSRSRWLGVVLDAFAAAGAQPPADVPPGPPMFQFADESAFSRLLTDAGLVDVTVERSNSRSSSKAATSCGRGSSKAACACGRCPWAAGGDAARDRTHFDELIDEYRTEDGYEVPVAVKLASGQAPRRSESPGIGLPRRSRRRGHRSPRRFASLGPSFERSSSRMCGNSRSFAS